MVLGEREETMITDREVVTGTREDDYVHSNFT